MGKPLKNTAIERLLGFYKDIFTLLRYGNLVFCSFNFRHTTQFDTLLNLKKKRRKFFGFFFSKIILWVQINFLDPGFFSFLKFHHSLCLCGMMQFKTAENQISAMYKYNFYSQKSFKDGFLSLKFLPKRVGTGRPCVRSYTVGFQKSLRIAPVRSKTTLISGCVCGKWVDPPFCKINTFFLMSLALCVPICRNFQSNGVNWRSFER